MPGRSPTASQATKICEDTNRYLINGVPDQRIFRRRVQLLLLAKLQRDRMNRCMGRSLPLDILPQPNDWTCGPTCLHAVYRFYGNQVSLDDVIDRTQQLEGGGTLAVLLGCDALRHGYQARIYSYNLSVFDPSWFKDANTDLASKLSAQLQHKTSTRLQLASHGYLEFLRLGGEVRMEDLSGRLIRRYLDQQIPLLTGLSSTYLYQEKREINENMKPDDVRGVPQGHFVVLRGYDRERGIVRVADPYLKNPWSKHLDYEVSLERVITAILLGVLTYDANLLVIRPQGQSTEGNPPLDSIQTS